MKIPFARVERTQEMDELFVHSAEQGSTEDGIEAGGLRSHDVSLTLAEATLINLDCLALPQRATCSDEFFMTFVSGGIRKVRGGKRVWQAKSFGLCRGRLRSGQ